mgnify:CR=1 FL=1
MLCPESPCLLGGPFIGNGLTAKGAEEAKKTGRIDKRLRVTDLSEEKDRILDNY